MTHMMVKVQIQAHKVMIGAVILGCLIGPEGLHGLNGLPRLRPEVLCRGMTGAGISRAFVG